VNTDYAAWHHCYRKQWFGTAEAAEAYKQRLWAREGAHDLNVYPCQLGSAGGPHFHVGGTPTNSKDHRFAVRARNRLRTVGRQTVLTDP
jgi:hypothetical protein